MPSIHTGGPLSSPSCSGSHRPKDRSLILPWESTFTPGMCRYIYAMWSITRSPIILGGDLTKLHERPWLRELLNNSMIADLSSRIALTSGF